jgi:hypothetical protein
MKKFISGMYVLVLVLVGLIMWCVNIFKLVNMMGGEISSLFIGRIVGTFVFPLGIILGFF